MSEPDEVDEMPKNTIREETPLRVKTKRKTRLVEVETDGGVKTFMAKEMMGGVRTAYMTAMGNLVRGKDGSVKRLGEMQPLLIAHCLFDPEGKQLVLTTEDISTTWPSTAIMEVFQLCQDLNGMNPDKEDDEGKK